MTSTHKITASETNLIQEKAKTFSLLSASLLISGTCIGAGMLALPLVTGLAGFLPGLAVNGICWLFMLLTGLLLVEATLWMYEGANVFSLAERFLGKIGKLITTVCFLFLYYCLLTAYFSGSIPLYTEALNRLLPIHLSPIMGYSLFFGLFLGIFSLNIKGISKINTLLVFGMILAYLLLVGMGISGIKSNNLATKSFSLSLLAIPTLFSAYGYHNILPTVTAALKRDAKKIRLAVLIGVTLPFVVYTFWQLIVVGTLTSSQIQQGITTGMPATEALKSALHRSAMIPIGNWFAFFALSTSILGVGFSIIDVFADSLKLPKKGLPLLFLSICAIAPPFLFSAYNPNIFLKALEYAGGIGEVILNGLIPILMVWIGRYKLRLKSEYSLKGGKTLLLGLMTFGCVVLFLEVYLLIS